jgi:triphosphoribosyl-dephospho-CoA synthase
MISSDDDLADAAVQALHDELAAYPKPGLVSPVDSGAHADMDHALMSRSAEALRLPFTELAAAGRRGLGFEEALKPLGISAERRMLSATGGVNTHRGAIFCLGLVVAAIARAEAELGSAAIATTVRAVLRATWGAALAGHASAKGASDSHGGQVRRTLGRDGARREAAAAFPGVFEVALPAYRAALEDGLDANAARVHTLFALMATVDDTTVLYRGGVDGDAFVRDTARRFLADGGCRRPGWQPAAEEIHRQFVARRLSAGGCADLLAATLLVAARCPAD